MYKVSPLWGGEVKEVDGVKYVKIHSGQKRRYGDTFYDYEVISELSAAEVERVCHNSIHKAIPESEWLTDYRAPECGHEKAFRPHYKFESKGDNTYFYSVCCLYSD